MGDPEPQPLTITVEDESNALEEVELQEPQHVLVEEEVVQPIAITVEDLADEATPLQAETAEDDLATPRKTASSTSIPTPIKVEDAAETKDLLRITSGNDAQLVSHTTEVSVDEDEELRVVYEWAENVEQHKETFKRAITETMNLKRWLTEVGSQDLRVRTPGAQMLGYDESDSESEPEPDDDETSMARREREDRKSRLKRRRSASKLKIKLEKRARRSKKHKKLRRIVRSITFQAVINIATFWALFGPDIQVMTIPKSADVAMAAIMLVIVFLFLFEIVAMSLATRSYLKSFFFWMDVLAVASLIPDTFPVFGAEGVALSVLTLARAGRAARAAARTARFARIIKLLDGYRRRTDDDDDGRLTWMDENYPPQDADLYHKVDQITESLREKSVVGEHMEGQVFKRIFFVVLIMFIFFTLLDPAVGSEQLQAEGALGELALALNYNATEAISFYRSHFGKIVELTVDNVALIYDGQRLDELRTQAKFTVELGAVVVSSSRTVCAQGCKAVFDRQDDVKLGAGFSVLQTVAVIVILIFAVFLVNYKIRERLVEPIERIVTMIKALALNPFTTLKIKNDFEDETGLIEAMVAKMAVLLQVGFGGAGISIISQNLSSSGSLVPLVKGQRVNGIFAYVAIHYFAEITQGLQEDITIFVNKMARVVHGEAARRGGIPYRNTGQGFYLFWPLPSGVGREEYDILAGATVDGAMKALRSIAIRLRNSQRLKRMLTRVPECAVVECTMSMHAGDAIGGAIGSPRKVDATYLSTDVNICTKLEKAARFFGSDFLVSESAVELMEPDTQERCVRLDRVTLPGVTSAPFLVYGVDSHPFYDLLNPSSEYYLSRRVSSFRTDDLKAEEIDAMDDQDYTEKLRDDKAEFLEQLELGVGYYLDRQWERARPHLERARDLTPGTRPYRPVTLLLKYLEKFDFQCPPDWECRDLDL